jgi:hypothetical protein
MIRESIYILWCDNCILIISLIDVLYVVLFKTITLTLGVELLYLFVYID